MKVTKAYLIESVEFDDGSIIRLGDVDDAGGVAISITENEKGVNVIRAESDGGGWDENWGRDGKFISDFI